MLNKSARYISKQKKMAINKNGAKHFGKCDKCIQESVAV